MTLCRAVETGNLAEVERLLAADTPVSAPDENGYLPIHHAAFTDHPKILKTLLDHGADSNAPTQWDPRAGSAPDRPLHIAAHGASLQFVQTLIDHGADIHATSHMGPRINSAAFGGNLPVVRLPLQFCTPMIRRPSAPKTLTQQQFTYTIQ